MILDPIFKWLQKKETNEENKKEADSRKEEKKKTKKRDDKKNDEEAAGKTSEKDAGIDGQPEPDGGEVTEFEEDGIDPDFEEFSPEQLAEVQNMLTMLESDEALRQQYRQEMNEAETLLLGTGDIDSAIDDLLIRDGKEDSIHSFDGETDFVEHISEYSEELPPDPVEENQKAVREEKAEREQIQWDSFSGKKLTVIIGILAGLIVVLGSVGLVLILRMRGETVVVPENAVLLTQPSYTSNKANYMYPNAEGILNGGTYTMSRILLDPLETVFYFQSPLDVSVVVATMTDDKEKTYFMDLHSVTSLLRSQESLTHELRMEPLDAGVKSFTVFIRDSVTGEEMEFAFHMSKPVVLSPARYVNSSAVVFEGEDGDGFWAERAEFSSARSSVHFRSSGGDGMPGSISMNEISALLSTRYTAPLTVETDGGQVLGRRDYAEISSLAATANVVFKNASRSVSVNRTVPAGSLLLNKSEDEMVVRAGPYSIALERMAYGNGRAVMVFHVVESNPETVDNMETEERRIWADMSVRLRVPSPDGDLVYDGLCFSTAQGSDVLFGDDENPIRSDGASVNEMVLEIQSIQIRLEDATVSLNLSEANKSRNKESLAAEEKLLDAFMSRLAMKAGEISRSEVSGFSPALLADVRLKSRYEPIDTGALYTAQILTSAMSGDSIDAVICEAWYGPGREAAMVTMHVVQAVKTADGWMIEKDRIVE